MFFLNYPTLSNRLVALTKPCHRDMAFALSAPTSKKPLAMPPLSPSFADPIASVAHPGQLNSPFAGVKSPAVKIGQIQTATGGLSNKIVGAWRNGALSLCCSVWFPHPGRSLVAPLHFCAVSPRLHKKHTMLLSPSGRKGGKASERRLCIKLSVDT